MFRKPLPRSPLHPFLLPPSHKFIHRAFCFPKTTSTGLLAHSPPPHLAHSHPLVSSFLSSTGKDGAHYAAFVLAVLTFVEAAQRCGPSQAKRPHTAVQVCSAIFLRTRYDSSSTDVAVLSGAAPAWKKRTVMQRSAGRS
eukprot:3695973-Rhodomonas_salina.2